MGIVSPRPASGRPAAVASTADAAARRWRMAMALVGVVALALRLAYLLQIAHSPLTLVLTVDGQEYDAWAQRIAGGSWLGTGAFFQSPLYPYLLAVVFAVEGHHIWIVRVLQATAGAASCVLLCDAGRSFVGRRAGLIAGGLLAVYPEAIFFDGLIQKSSLDLLLMTALLALAGRCLAGPRRRVLAALGVVLGLVMLNRENARVLYPLIAFWLVAGFRAVPVRRRMGWVGVVTAGVVCVTLPVALRNYAVSGDLLISTSQFGYNLYLGNRAGANGTFEPLVADHGNVKREREDSRQLAEQARGRTLSAAEVSDYWSGRAFSDIRAHPGAWVRLVGRKVLMVLNAGEYPDTESMQEYALYSIVLRTLRWFSLGIVLPVAVAGLWLTAGAWSRLWLLYGMVASLLVSVVAFYVYSRYRYPMVPVLLLFDGAAVSAVASMAGEPRRWGPAVISGAVVAVVCYLPMTGVVNDTHVNVGTELIRQGRPAEAVPILETAAAIRPDDPFARFNLGVAWARSGDLPSSIRAFSEADRLRPNDAKTLAGLGASLAGLGRSAEAVAVFERAVALEPASPQARSNYGAALWSAGARDAAIDQYREAVRLRPDDAVAENNLAVALQQAGHLAEAMPHYDLATQLKPDYAEAHSNLALALAEAGRTDEAIGHFQQALRLSPDNFGVHANYGDLLLRTLRSSEAAAEFEAAVRSAPDSPDVMLALLPRLARAYAQAGRRADAADTLERGVTLARAAGNDAAAGQLAQAIRDLRNGK